MKTQTKWLLGAGAGAAALGVGYWLWKKGDEAHDVLVPGGDSVPAGELPGGEATLPGEPPTGGDRIYGDIMPPTGGSVGPGSTPGGDPTTTNGGGAGGGAEGNEARDKTKKEKAAEALAALKNMQLTLKRAGFTFVRIETVPLGTMTPLTAQDDKWGAYTLLRGLPGADVWVVSGGVTPDNKIYFIAILKANPKVKAALRFVPPAAGGTGGGGATTTTDEKTATFKKLLATLYAAGWRSAGKTLPAGVVSADATLASTVVTEVSKLVAADPEGAKAQGVELMAYVDGPSSTSTDVYQGMTLPMVFVAIYVKRKLVLVISKPLTAAQMGGGAGSRTTPDGKQAAALAAQKKLLEGLAAGGWTPLNERWTASSYQEQLATPEIVARYTAFVKATGLSAAAWKLLVKSMKFYANPAAPKLYAVLVDAKGTTNVFVSSTPYTPAAAGGSGAGGGSSNTLATGGGGYGAGAGAGAGVASAAARAAAARQKMVDALAKGGWAVTSGSVSGYRKQSPTPLLVSLYNNMLTSAGLTRAAAEKAGLQVTFYADLADKRLFAIAMVGGTSTMLRYLHPYTPETVANGLVTTSAASTSTAPSGGTLITNTAVPGSLQVQITKALDKLRAAGLVPVTAADIPKSLIPIPYKDAKKYYDMAQQVVGAAWKVEGFWNGAKTQIFIRFTGVTLATRPLPQTWLKMVLGQRAAG